MNPIIAKTFGGLSAQYYLRQFSFGLLLTVAMIYLLRHGGAETAPASYSLYFLFLLNTVLYPYARFAYESIVGFVIGNNVFVVNAFVMLLAKLFTMLLCWSMALFIAPLGLVWLYFHHSRDNAG